MILGNVLVQQQIWDKLSLHVNKNTTHLLPTLFPHYDSKARERAKVGRTTSKLWKRDRPSSAALLEHFIVFPRLFRSDISVLFQSDLFSRRRTCSATSSRQTFSI